MRESGFRRGRKAIGESNDCLSRGIAIASSFMKEVFRALLRVLALAGLAISVFLLWQKATGRISSIAGCGAGSDCANVLGSRWSQFFLIPVSAFSAALYLALVVLSAKPRAVPLMAAAVVLLGAAAWFTGLQVFVLRAFCPWCLGTHLVGVACGIVILKGLDPRPERGALRTAAGSGGILLLVLVLGQVAGPRPDTHLLTEEGPRGQGAGPAAPAEGGRTVAFFEGVKIYQVDSLPHAGAPDAPHVLVKFFDYTCGSCRDMHGDLKALQAKYPGKVCVVLLPTPLHRSCNPHLSPRMRDHAGACEIARLALAVWRAHPESFEKVHDALFASRTRSAEGARQVVARLLPAADLEAALKDPWVEKQLQANVTDFQALVANSDRMPKLLIRDNTMMHGLSKSTKVFVQLVGDRLGLEGGE